MSAQLNVEVSGEEAAMLDLLRDRYGVTTADQMVFDRGFGSVAELSGIDWDDARRVATLRRVDIQEPEIPGESQPDPRADAIAKVALVLNDWMRLYGSTLVPEVVAELAVDAIFPGLRDLTTEG